MVKTEQNTKQKVASWMKWSAIGGGVAVVLCSAILVVLAWLMSGGIVNEITAQKVIILCVAVSGGVGTSLAIKRVNQFVLPTALVVTAVYLVGTNIVSGLMCGGGWSGLKIDAQFIAALSGGLVASFFVKTTKKKGKRVSSK